MKTKMNKKVMATMALAIALVSGGFGAATLKKAELVIVCKSASDNTKKEADKLARKFHCPILETKEITLDEFTHRENAKVMAIADKSLSLAILSNSDEDFIARN